MTTPDSIPTDAVVAPTESYLVGVEIGPALLRAGVFTPSLDLIGKAKLSTKLERGPAAVIERVARCVEYAVDECDLPLNQIQGIGVGAPGLVDSKSGQILQADSMDWKSVPLRDAMQKMLRMPVFVENHFRLGTLGVFSREFGSDPRRMAAMFLGPEIGGGLVVNNELLDPAKAAPQGQYDWPGPDGIFAVMPQQEFRNARVRDLRKSSRKGNPAVREYVRAIALQGGEIAVELMRVFQPEVIILGGGLMDEMREEIVGIIEGVLRANESTSPAAQVQLFSSILGDLACMTGGAALAARKIAALGDSSGSKIFPSAVNDKPRL